MRPGLLGAVLARPGADVIVHVGIGHRPAALLGDLPAVLDLAVHAQTVTFGIRADARVDTGCLRHRAPEGYVDFTTMPAAR